MIFSAFYAHFCIQHILNFDKLQCVVLLDVGTFTKLYWLATSGGRFLNILFSCNRHIVLSVSIFWFNKLGVNVGILLLYFFK